MRHLPVALALAAALAVSATWGAGAADLPDYLKPISGPPAPPSAQDIATRNVLQLNTTMFSLYDTAGMAFRRNILAKHPVVLALFSGAGGRMILYRPGQPPLEAPPVPKVYQVMKSLGHSTMAVSEVVLPYLDNPGDTSWVAPMRAYLTEMKSALDGIGAAQMPDEWRANARAILENNIAFMEESLARGVIRLDAVQAFAKKQAPVLRNAIAWAAQTQVEHWMGVLDGWKTELGGSFDQAYGASNTIYVARQNNVLFSVLAQYFGPEAINDRLVLIETISFTTTPDDMLTALVRIISDRSVGGLFFNNDRLMDYELMGGDARKAIIAGMKARGKEAFLPPQVPFGSRQWPALITGGTGAASLDDLH
ncbi:hypothetical protein ACI7BZ_16335 [Xanthobacter sp. AM11]|uniref:hypothetical protein n=1 Tax=Xanthobacter sp. AM11 TaxID=3380643 RepID=UPI0039BFF89C